jgi:PAS domain S-box-containing protein
MSNETAEAAKPDHDPRDPSLRPVRRARPRTLRGVLRWLLIAPLVPLALVSGMFVYTQWQASHEAVYDELERTAKAVAGTIDQEVEIGKAILDTLAASELIDRGDREGFRRLAIEALRGRPDSWIALAEASGRQVMRTFEPVGSPTINPTEIARRHSEVEWRGRTLPLSTQGLSERVVSTGMMSNTGLYFGQTIQRPAVAIGVPVKRDGAVTHVLILGFAPDRMVDLILGSARPERRVGLIDATGRVIASSRDPGEAMGRSVTDELKALIAARESGFREGPNAAREDVVAAFRRTALTDWTVLVSSPRGVAFAPAWRVLAAWTLTLLAVLAISAWAVRALWLRLAPPLVAMGRAARAIHQGTTPELPDSGIVEIDRLAQLLREAAQAEARGRGEALRRTRAEEQARAREEREQLLRRVLDSIHSFVGVMDVEGRLVEMNRAPLERAGLERDAVLGRPYSECPWWLDEGTRERVRDAVARAARGERVRFDVAARLGDGEAVHVDMQVAPMRDADGRIVMLVASGVDVTERTRTEAALREADRQKDEFLAVLAHELRNPLAPIRAAGHVIRARGTDDPAIARAGEIVERQATQLVRLVDDLLEVSRITQGRIELRSRREPLEPIVAAAIEAARPGIEAAGHRLEVSWPGEPMQVEADAARLSQAILNVLQNAAKYTPCGGRIALRLTRRDGAARLEIEDDGIGIDADTLPRIFDMFVQGERGAGGSRGGLGIGLALARRLVRMQGGDIEASSDGPGRGSRFVVELPLAAGTMPSSASSSTPGSVADVGAPRRAVLLVDDNVDAAETLRLALELDGHAVRVAHDGRSALDAAARERPDAVVLDIGLPDVDGHEVARRLRARFGADCPRLIALSGWGQERDKRLAVEAGFERHFTKPVEPTVLARALAEPAPGPVPAA